MGRHDEISSQVIAVPTDALWPSWYVRLATRTSFDVSTKCNHAGSLDSAVQPESIVVHIIANKIKRNDFMFMSPCS